MDQNQRRGRALTCSALTIALFLFSVVACNEGNKGLNQSRPPNGNTLPDSVQFAATSTMPDHPEHWPGSFGIGRGATAEDIQAWDIDVMPDGAGLPPGSGTVTHGATLYAAKCASCHGATGIEGPNDRLIGREPVEGFPFGRDPALLGRRTIGNYWPYATTIFDYIQRAMPQNAPGSLTTNEVYSLTAFLLHKNKIIPEDAVMNAETLPQVVMPARERFVLDNRGGGVEIR